MRGRVRFWRPLYLFRVFCFRSQPQNTRCHASNQPPFDPATHTTHIHMHTHIHPTHPQKMRCPGCGSSRLRRCGAGRLVRDGAKVCECFDCHRYATLESVLACASAVRHGDVAGGGGSEAGGSTQSVATNGEGTPP